MRFGVVNLSGDILREQRRFALQQLRNFGMGRKIMEEKISIEAEKMVKSIEDCLNSLKNNDAFDVTKHFRLPVANVISSVVVGKTFSSDDDTKFKQFNQLIRDFAKLVTFEVHLLELFPWLRYVPLFGHFGYDEILRQREDWSQLISSEIDEHKNQTSESEEATDFTDAYLKGIKPCRYGRKSR